MNYYGGFAGGYGAWPAAQHQPEATHDEDDEDDEDGGQGKGNVLPVWGNEKSMNLNHLILTNIQVIRAERWARIRFEGDRMFGPVFHHFFDQP